MKIFFGVLLSTLILFVANILAWKMSIGFVGLDTAQNDKIIETTLVTYLLSFVHSFAVIAGLTWMISQVMPLLDKYRKRVLFIFILAPNKCLFTEIPVTFWKCKFSVSTDIRYQFLLLYELSQS